MDEEDGEESETVEVRYRLAAERNAAKFEVRVECEVGNVDEHMVI